MRASAFNDRSGGGLHYYADVAKLASGSQNRASSLLFPLFFFSSMLLSVRSIFLVCGKK